jgi:dephospho-CoA kinase
MFKELGAVVVDADQLAREVVAPGQPALDEIRERFGPEMITPEGTLDRVKMGELVFSDHGARRLLNAIVHPRVAEASRDAIASHAAAGAEVVLYEAALLVENGIHRGLDGLIVVSAPEEVQLARVRERDGLDERDARARVAAQLPLEDKIAAADYVIDNSGSLEHTGDQVRVVWDRVRERLGS